MWTEELVFAALITSPSGSGPASGVPGSTLTISVCSALVGPDEGGRVGEDLALDVRVEAEGDQRLAVLGDLRLDDLAVVDAGDARRGLLRRVEALGVVEQDLDHVRILGERKLRVLLGQRVAEEDQRRDELDQERRAGVRNPADLEPGIEEAPRPANEARRER